MTHRCRACGQAVPAVAGQPGPEAAVVATLVVDGGATVGRGCRRHVLPFTTRLVSPWLQRH